ncbi:GDSL esterase/lipase At3g48460 [Phalaenopsis equestris]|uniref:GDSL esterase/lipase At3g48460 n=1 Tax=Phalaenopsis equestris TaxID=78828 RepID=UPI0009E585CD|nr:GDSL esterase/lipase At3g48460 [Phalaenopsis equestris]
MDYSISLLSLIFLLPLTLSSLPPPPNHPFSKIYAFGDSFTDTGNTHSSTGPYAFRSVSNPPYGTTFFHHPTNRYSDGRLVIDFLATALSLPFLPPYLNQSSHFSSHGVNFAVAGSTALDHEVFVKHNITLDLKRESLGTQLGWFNGYLEEKGCGRVGSMECRSAMEGALFWVGEIGANDYAYSFGSSLSPKAIRQQAVRNVISFLQEILKKGAKHIIVQGLPLNGCLPLSLFLTPPEDRDALGCSSSVNKLSSDHNDLLQQKLHQLRSHHPNAIISFADYLRAHRTVVQNPKANGFVEPFKACCGAGGGQYNFDIFNTCGSKEASAACSNPSEYVNWDGVHLTEAMYEKVAEMFFHGGYCQPSFDVFLRKQEK